MAVTFKLITVIERRVAKVFATLFLLSYKSSNGDFANFPLALHSTKCRECFVTLQVLAKISIRISSSAQKRRLSGPLAKNYCASTTHLLLYVAHTHTTAGPVLKMRVALVSCFSAVAMGRGSRLPLPDFIRL